MPQLVRRAVTTPKKPAKNATKRRGATGVQLGEDTARSRILQGAAQVFAERGARLASVENILLRSGISRRTFYRFYESKEDVMLALYKLGTEGLLTACRSAMTHRQGPMQRFEQCINAHLRNARAMPRLIFVLGGEAQHYESPLHARRREVHSQLVEFLLTAECASTHDELTVRTLILALEGVVRFMLENGDEGRTVSAKSLADTKRVMMRLCSVALTSPNHD